MLIRLHALEMRPQAETYPKAQNTKNTQLSNKTHEKNLDIDATHFRRSFFA